MKLLEKASIKNLELKNRYIMAPMCMYAAHKKDGIPHAFHFSHYVSRAIGQVGLIIVEATGIVPEGRITNQCLGLWNDDQKDAFSKIVDAVHEQGSKIALQLNHAGRKCRTEDPVIYAPSAIAYNEKYRTPKEMSQQDIKQMIKDFATAAKRADEAGFDAIEIHMAHGYLLSSFMSPYTNKRIDKYRDATVLFEELMESIHSVWPKEKPIFVRVSVTDYEENGLDVKGVAKILDPILDTFDVIHVSSGGITPIVPHAYPSYQVPFAQELKTRTKKPVIAVGLINTTDQAIDIIENDRADFVALGRALIRNPHFVLESYMQTRQKDKIPFSYQRGFRD